MKFRHFFLFGVFISLTSFSSSDFENSDFAKLACNFEDVTYKEDIGSQYGDYVRFFNHNGNTVEFIAKTPHDVHGKMKIDGKKLTVVECGEATGNFTILEDCAVLAGSFKLKGGSGIVNVVNYKRKR